MAENKIQLTKADRKKVCFRHQFLQGSWNYERMQNGGWCFAMIPAIKKLYTSKDDQIAALKRHLEFYNTHPYVSAPVIGVTLALEEERANGAPIDDVAIQGVKVGMIGPLRRVATPPSGSPFARFWVHWALPWPCPAASPVRCCSSSRGTSSVTPSCGTRRSLATRSAPPSPRTSPAV
mgnify:FL=1